MSRTLKTNNSALLVVDIQEAFRRAISDFDLIVQRAKACCIGFNLLGCPVVFTEQYPKGLGHTAPELIESIENARVFEKSKFSACASDDLVEFLRNNDIENVAVAGVETHVCVNQTVHELIDLGFDVHLVEDAVGSRHQSDKDTAIRKLAQSGAIPSTVETALFELLVDSKHPQFKEIQALIK